jgi:hypothetical protein
METGVVVRTHSLVNVTIPGVERACHLLVGTNLRHETGELNSRVLQENEGLDVGVLTSAHTRSFLITESVFPL